MVRILSPLFYSFVWSSQAFGLGDRSPGRFFAANELKALAAYILLNYDLKLGGDGKRPANMYYAANVVPSMSGEVLFRKRHTDFA